MDLRYKLNNASDEVKNIGLLATPWGVCVHPSVIGRIDMPKCVLGKSSGKSSILMFLQDHGLEATPEQVEMILVRVKEEAMITKSLISEESFLRIYDNVVNNR